MGNDVLNGAEAAAYYERLETDGRVCSAVEKASAVAAPSGNFAKDLFPLKCRVTVPCRPSSTESVLVCARI